MKRAFIWRRAVAIAVCLLLAFGLTATALAYSPIPDLEKECTLTLQHKFSDTEFELYRVASVSKEASFTLVPDLADCNVKLSGLDQGGWKGAALALSGYVSKQGITPLHSGKTSKVNESDEYAKLTFDKLPVGLYLVEGKQETREDTGMSYIFSPFLICLPDWLDPEADGTKDWTYNVTMNTKYEAQKPGQESIHVLKRWNDSVDQTEEGYKNYERPKEVVVELLRDGETFDTVTLKADNGWDYTWEKLETNHDWRIVEEVPELEGIEDASYEVLVNRVGVTFVLTNNIKLPPKTDPEPSPSPTPGPDPSPTPRPSPSPSPTPTPTDIPGTDPPTTNPPTTDPPTTNPPTTDPPTTNPPTTDPPTDIDDPDIPTTDMDEPDPPPVNPVDPPVDVDDPTIPLPGTTPPTGGEPEPNPEDIPDPDIPLTTLPQTGMLWWPVPVLALSGMVLFLFGWAGKRREDN